jgi:RND family efflux transporter MFP subunit
MIDCPEAEKAFRTFFSSISVNNPLPPLPEIQDDQLKIFLASRNVISEYYNIQRDELQLERRSVKAPFNGTYKEVYMETGAYTNTGGRVALAIRTDELELEVPLNRVDATWVNIGDPVQVLSEKRNLSWEGRVIRKSPYVDENTQSQELFIQIPYNRNKPLLAGEYLHASFPVRSIEGVMEIPRNSVFNSNEVFIISNGRLAKREINVVKENERTLIFNGLPAGDSVVVQQLINVSEGTLVQLENEVPDAPGQGAGKPEKNTSGGSAKKENSSKKKSGN